MQYVVVVSNDSESPDAYGPFASYEDAEVAQKKLQIASAGDDGDEGSYYDIVKLMSVYDPVNQA